MATLYKIHPDNPQSRKIEAVVEVLKQGGVALYPTDTVYAIGCDLQHKGAVQRVRQLKQLANDKPLTFLCSSLSNIADYAHVSDPAYRIIRRFIPGPYTFFAARYQGRTSTGHEPKAQKLRAFGCPIVPFAWL